MNTILAPGYVVAKHHHHKALQQMVNNIIPPRLQWNANSGYCGEVSLISAGLYYGQYISQYDARLATSKNATQKDQLLLGTNAVFAANKMHLNAVEWNACKEKNTNDFLVWVKQNVVKGYPVAIGIFTNEYLFYNKTDPKAGDPNYDHIVPVTGIESSHPLNCDDYFGDDVLNFNDNGLWAPSNKPVYLFNSNFDEFQATRKQANAKDGNIYSLSNKGTNYGIAITGVMDLNCDTLPVRLDTNLNYENPEIHDKSNTRPAAMPIILTITVSGLKPGEVYNLYRYNALESVPNAGFNSKAGNAFKKTQIKIKTGSTFVMTQQINSNEIAVYRAVKASAP